MLWLQGGGYSILWPDGGEDKKTKEEFDYAQRVGHRVALAGRRHELMLRPLGNVVVLVPPLAIAPSEVDFLIDGVRESIREATEEP